MIKMINKQDFNKIINNINRSYKKRDLILGGAHAAIRSSKQAIYSVHRSEFKKAKTLIDSAKKELQKLRTTIKKEKKLREIGAFNAAEQEYAEAVTFYDFMKHSKIQTIKAVGVSETNYLLGICDLTGELGREAVIAATKKDIKFVKKIRDVVDELHGEFMKLNNINNELRKKSDSIKWNLKKIEEVYYDLTK